MKVVKLLVGIGLVSMFCFQSVAQSVIVNRTALDVLLGSNRADEGFERYPLSPGATTGYGPEGTLTSTNAWGGLNNPIISGITLRSTYSSADPNDIWIQWNGNTFGDLPTKTIYSSGSLLLDFWNPTLAFGIDLKDFGIPAWRQTYIAGVNVYGADDSTLLFSTSAINLTDPTAGVFFGYEFGSGIGAVEFFTVSGADPLDIAPHIFSPKLDNLAFSTMAVPEPTTLSLAVIGAAILFFLRRRLPKM